MDSGVARDTGFETVSLVSWLQEYLVSGHRRSLDPTGMASQFSALTVSQFCDMVCIGNSETVMPNTEVCFFQEEPGDVPVLDWLRELRRCDKKAFAKCVVRIERLAELGHELRRPEADFLRDGIHELRIRKGRVNYRILYFFHGQNVSLLAHGLTKEDIVPEADIERALRRKEIYEAAPDEHTYKGELEDESPQDKGRHPDPQP